VADLVRAASSQYEIIGVSEHIQNVRRQIAEAAESEKIVLVLGPRGTGKELIARNIHAQSSRGTPRRPLEIVNCGAIPSELFESELFGHERGAFTGAREKKDGQIKRAQGGTLFLDEVGALKPDHQVKLLRFLQERTYTPVGGKISQEADVRIVAATNEDLTVEKKERSFREDLYDRLAQYIIRTEALRDRPEDVVCLLNYFRKAMDHRLKFLVYSYKDLPGNVRKLKNLAESSYEYERKELVREWPEGSEVVSYIDDPRLYNAGARDVNQFLKKVVEAYEIITLWQFTELSQTKIAEHLRMEANKVKSARSFKKCFGFDLPPRTRPCLERKQDWRLYPEFLKDMGLKVAVSGSGRTTKT
jgi:DNA-binding NtrC family response regulator